MGTRAWFNKSNISIALLAVIAVLLVLLVLKNNNDNNNNNAQNTTTNKTKTVTIAPSGMKYPIGWQELSQISLDDKNTGVVSEAVHNNPDAQVIIRIDNNLLAQDFNINSALSETVAKLKGSLNRFNLVKKEIVQIGKNPAISITYKDLISNQIYESNQLIVPTQNKTFYLTIFAKEPNFGLLMSAVDKIKVAFASFVDSNQK